MTIQLEEWRTIIEWPAYEISNIGQIRRIVPYRSTYVGRILRPYLSRGYYSIRIAKNGKYKARTIHSLVAEAFIGPRPKGSVINHKDTCKTNNRADNLEYTTCAGNSQHAYAHGLFAPPMEWRNDPEKVARAAEKRKANRRPDASRGIRNGVYTHPETRLRGAAHGCAKYTRAQLQEALDLLSQNRTNREIMHSTGVHESTVSNIKNGKHWINKE